MNAIHLCCGAGGTTLAFEQTGIETIYAFDLNPIVTETHKANFPNAPCHIKDIRAIHATDLPTADVWTCGLPCAPYSNAGARLQDKDPRDISPTLRHLIAAAHEHSNAPKYIFLENVPPYMNSVARNLLLETLSQCNYRHHDAIYPHANYGVPQTRKRWHLIASLHGPVPNPIPTHSKDPGLFELKPWVTFGKIREHNPQRIQSLSPIALRGLLRRQRRKVKDAMKRNSGPYNVMQVVTDDSMMPTITSSIYKGLARNQAVAIGCETRLNGSRIFYYRSPTQAEIMRAQTFPPDFQFPCNKHQRYEMIGRAVPPQFAKAVALAILAQEGERAS